MIDRGHDLSQFAPQIERLKSALPKEWEILVDYSSVTGFHITVTEGPTDSSPDQVPFHMESSFRNDAGEDKYDRTLSEQVDAMLNKLAPKLTR